jgi:chemotaxis protein CheX
MSRASPRTVRTASSQWLGKYREIANTIAGNARKTFGSGLNISVPVKFQGALGEERRTRTRVRARPFLITLKWAHHNALVCVDLERKH